MAECEQFRSDLAVRLLAALRELAAQLFGQHHDFRALLGMAQAAFGPRAGRTLAITGGFEFGNKASLLVLMESTCDLPHHDARRIAIVGQVVAVSGQHADAACDQRQNSKLLRDQLTGQARGILDDDDPNAVALDPVEQTGKTFPASIGSAPVTATSANSSTSSNPAVFEKAAIAARWRTWLSPSALVAELVRR